MSEYVWLIFIACIFIQPSLERKLMCLMLAIVNGGHSQMFGASTDITYYLSAAIADFVLVAFLIALYPKTKICLHLACLCTISILINAVGYGMYYLWYEPKIYNLACNVLYTALIIRLMLRVEGDTKRDNRDIKDIMGRGVIPLTDSNINKLDNRV